MHRYQVDNQLRPKKNVPVLMPDGRTVQKGNNAGLPPKVHSAQRKKPRRELSHSDPDRRIRKATALSAQGGHGAPKNVPNEIQKYVNLS